MAISLLQFVYGTFTVLDSCGASVVREEKRRQSLEKSSSSFGHRLTSPGSSISQLTGSFDAKEITSQNKQVETQKNISSVGDQHKVLYGFPCQFSEITANAKSNGGLIHSPSVPTLCISSKRNADRNTHQFGQLGLNFKLVPPVRTRETCISKRQDATGCALAHQNAWIETVKSKSKQLILEADVSIGNQSQEEVRRRLQALYDDDRYDIKSLGIAEMLWPV